MYAYDRKVLNYKLVYKLKLNLSSFGFEQISR